MHSGLNAVFFIVQCDSQCHVGKWQVELLIVVLDELSGFHGYDSLMSSSRSDTQMLQKGIAERSEGIPKRSEGDVNITLKTPLRNSFLISFKGY